MQLYNTLTRSKEPFEPLAPPQVSLYSCGPTVYRDVHIGNLRTFLMTDWLRRALSREGYRVLHVKNITDVGHMRLELLELGEDKVIASARAQGKTSLEIARHYTRRFMEDEAWLGILPADVFPKATDHVPQCIALISRLVEQGYAYASGGNVYFDIGRFPSYGRLSGNLPADLIRGEGSQVDPLKRRPEDFALWKGAEPGRELKWPSPWGEGFPGWHIECSAMSLHYLGETFDLHTGGVDNIFPHHEDEIAQSEAAVGHPVVRYWVHGQHLLADGLKMSKSTGNDYSLRDLVRRGFDPLAFRYLCLTVHYRARLNFTFNALKAAQRGLSHLRRFVEDPAWQDFSQPESGPAEAWRVRFSEHVEDDLNLPRALAEAWRMLADPALSREEKGRLLVEADEVLGLRLAGWPKETRALPPRIAALAQERTPFRVARRYQESDRRRGALEAEGYEVRDQAGESTVLKRSQVEWKGFIREISAAKEVPSLLNRPDACEATVSLVAYNNWPELKRCYESVRAQAGPDRVQVVMVEGGSTDETREGVEGLVAGDRNAVVWYADHPLGEGAFRNVTLRQALGTTVVLLDVSVSLSGDIFSPLAEALGRPGVGAAGPRGLNTKDCQHFEESAGPEVHAMTLYCFALPRRLVAELGFMDERFRFYRHLDLDFSFRIRSCGYRIEALPDLALVYHPHLVWERMDEHERNRRSRANFYRFYRRWHHRRDLYGSTPG